MWPLTERRSYKRYSVNLDASISCTFTGSEETVSARILEISPGGARLSLERLQIGPYHLTVGDTPEQLRLTVPFTDGQLTARLEIMWYNYDEQIRRFIAGVEFLDMNKEDKAALKQALKKL